MQITSKSLARKDHGAAATPAAPRFSLRVGDTAPGGGLLSVRYGAVAGRADVDSLSVPLPVLAGADQEHWGSREPVRRGESGGIAWAENGSVLFAHIYMEEPADLERASAGLYDALGRLQRERGYPATLRVWNHLSDINGGAGDAERYRRFSLGRHRALSQIADFERALPAASAIGTPAGSGVQIYLMAGRAGGEQVENPRQTSAFRYPREYGPASPSFSRALRVAGGSGEDLLLVSGTASIVGHQSLHAGDVEAQLAQTLDNLRALWRHAAPGRACRPVAIKAYLRHDDDLPRVLPKLEQAFADAPLQVLHADLCRRELLVEVEGVFRLTSHLDPV